MAGPTWETAGRQPVVGEVIASSPSPKPNSIAWLLLRARATSGNGLFTHVQFIQRLNTVGGSVPATVCRQEQAGQQLRAAYTADYLFYGAKTLTVGKDSLERVQTKIAYLEQAVSELSDVVFRQHRKFKRWKHSSRPSKNG